jgi:hypothetical protein
MGLNPSPGKLEEAWATIEKDPAADGAGWIEGSSGWNLWRDGSLTEMHPQEVEWFRSQGLDE